MTKTPLWKFAEQAPSGSHAQTKTRTATAQAQPVTSTPASAQHHRQAPAYFSQPQAAPSQGARLMPSESLDEDRLSDFPESKLSLLIAKPSELLDRVGNFCELERWDTEEQKRVMGMKCPLYHNPARATISLAVPWHSVAEEIADLNLKIDEILPPS